MTSAGLAVMWALLIWAGVVTVGLAWALAKLEVCQRNLREAYRQADRMYKHHVAVVERIGRG